jgi:hypothetical protein
MILVWLLTQLQIIIVRYHIILFESHIQYNFKGFSPPIKFYAFDNQGGFNSLVGVRGGGGLKPSYWPQRHGAPSCPSVPPKNLQEKKRRERKKRKRGKRKRKKISPMFVVGIHH